MNTLRDYLQLLRLHVCLYPECSRMVFPSSFAKRGINVRLDKMKAAFKGAM